MDSLAWSDLAVVLAICREGSLSGAARQLGCTHSTVFRKINAIEEAAGVRFFERLPSGYLMTETGELALAYAERIETEFHALHREIVGRDARLRGPVRITAPDGLVAEILPPILAEFQLEHPGVRIELVEGMAAFDLGRREADIAIRATRRPPDDALGQKICGFRFAVYASEAYLRRNPSPHLVDHEIVALSGYVERMVPQALPSIAHVREKTVFETNSPTAALNAARAGLGVTMMSCYRTDPIEDLYRVGDYLSHLDLDLWILTHTDLRQTARVKALMKHLAPALRARADLFEGKLGRTLPRSGRSGRARRRG